jgi:hypothetical protein
MKTEVITCSIRLSYSLMLHIPRNLSTSSEKTLFLKKFNLPIVDTFEKSEGCPL